jgi:hypothetical protein
MYGTQRTGVRVVLTNVSKPSRIDDYSAWYDSYGAGLLKPGYLANDYRFENPNAIGDDSDPRFAAIYDIVTPDPATAWPDTENSSDYPRDLFRDPRSGLVSPVFRASYALVGTQLASEEHGPLTGVYLALTDGSDDTSRQQWASRVLDTGFFFAVSRLRVIEGFPQPAEWLEIFETDQHDGLGAHTKALTALEPDGPDDGVRNRRAGSFELVSVAKT